MVTRRHYIKVIKWQEIPENRMYRSKKHRDVCSARVESCFPEKRRNFPNKVGLKPFPMKKTMIQIILWHQVNHTNLCSKDTFKSSAFRSFSLKL